MWEREFNHEDITAFTRHVCQSIKLHTLEAAIFCSPELRPNLNKLSIFIVSRKYCKINLLSSNKIGKGCKIRVSK